MIILPDVDVLVYSFRESAEQHERYRSWLDELLDSQDDLLLVDAVLVSVVRIVTKPRIADPPATTGRALDLSQHCEMHPERGPHSRPPRSVPLCKGSSTRTG